jgi:hypothetical protein
MQVRLYSQAINSSKELLPHGFEPMLQSLKFLLHGFSIGLMLLP